MKDMKTIEVVNDLFERLIAINPAFKQSWPTEEEFKATKKEWVIAFVESGINTIEQLKKGLSKIRLDPSPFIPSPGQFIELCKLAPEEMNAPSTEQAYDEACKKSHPCYGKEKNWSHEAVRNAAHRVGSYELRSEPKSKTFPVFKEEYEKALGDYRIGRNLNQIESQSQDTPENRMKYQEYWGWWNQSRKLFKNPYNIKILSYEEWLSSGS